MSHDRPIGLPDRALTLGADRTGSACTRRWWFARAEGLRPRTEGRALTYGTAWHAAMEDVHRWWQGTGGEPYPHARDERHLGLVCVWCGGEAGDPSQGRTCRHCSNTGQGPIGRATTSWWGTDRAPDAVVLMRALRGWFEVYGDVPPPGWSVLDVERPLAMPIPSPESASKQTYAPELCWIVAPDGRARLARTGEGRPDAVLPAGCRAEWARTPAWVSVRLDTLWITDRRALYVQEFKSSGDPKRYASMLGYDPQVTIYELAVEYALRHGHIRLTAVPGGDGLLISHSGSASIAGWQYDIASSHLQRDPKVLKSGLLSAARSSIGSVPTWRLRDALVAHGVSPSDRVAAPRKGKPRQAVGPDEVDESDTRTWADVIAEQGLVDAKLYLREFGLSGPIERDRALREAYAYAKRVAGLHRSAAVSKPGSSELDLLFPRVPICRGPGAFCPFRGPCLADGPHAREAYTVRDFAPVAAVEEIDETEAEEPTPSGGSPWDF